jgi:hypothetical protein
MHALRPSPRATERRSASIRLGLPRRCPGHFGTRTAVETDAKLVALALETDLDRLTSSDADLTDADLGSCDPNGSRRCFAERFIADVTAYFCQVGDGERSFFQSSEVDCCNGCLDISATSGGERPGVGRQDLVES